MPNDRNKREREKERESRAENTVHSLNSCEIKHEFIYIGMNVKCSAKKKYRIQHG